MESKLLKNISQFLGALMTVVLVMTYTSCSDEDTTDTTGFALLISIAPVSLLIIKSLPV